MTISKEKLEKFRTIYKKHFGQGISEQEALELGTNLINFVRIIARPIPSKVTKGGKNEKQEQ